MKVVDIDATMTALRCKKREEAEKGNGYLVNITDCCIKILGGMPQLDIMDSIDCKHCFWYDADHKRCQHKNGLTGRVLPNYYCSYASYHYDGADDEPDPDFAEFDEEETE